MFWFCARVTDKDEIEEFRKFNKQFMENSESELFFEKKKVEDTNNQFPTAGAPAYNQNIVPIAGEFNFLSDNKVKSERSFSLKTEKSAKSNKSYKSGTRIEDIQEVSDYEYV